MNLLVLLVLSQGTTVRLSDPAVNESSGLAASPSARDAYYTHNDSGDTPRFFRFNAAGQVTGIFTLQGATAVDWEDMSATRQGKKSFLYLGDIGDNAKQRTNLKVYEVEEPKGEGRALSHWKAYPVAYSDGPRDAEAMWVRPNSKELWIVSKESSGESGVYSGNLRDSGTTTLQRRGTLNVSGVTPFDRLVTGGDISSDGKKILICTYTKALLFSVQSNWWQGTPTTVSIPLQQQGEAICFDAKPARFVISSEGSPCPVTFLSLP